MAAETGIEWCDSTFNPWVGCTKVGPGCDHCYAEGWAKRSGTVQWGPHAERRRTTPQNWRKPLQWDRDHEAFQALHGRRQRVFCASLADWLDNQVPIEWLIDLLYLVRTTPNLDWLLLSKRVGNWRKQLEMARLTIGASNLDKRPLREWVVAWLDGVSPTNVLLGATVVNQQEADRDVPKLLATPAAVRFLSIEPMLGPIKLGTCWFPRYRVDGSGVHWVICGGESGPGARPMHPDWARSLREQCASAGVPFLFKQWGEYAEARLSNVDASRGERFVELDGTDSTGWTIDKHVNGSAMMVRIGKKSAGRLLDGVEHNGFPEVA